MGGIPSSSALREVGDALRYGTGARKPFERMVEREDGWTDWVHPLPGYRMQCCDCGLVHDMEFAIVQPNGEDTRLNDGEGPEGVIILRARRERPA